MTQFDINYEEAIKTIRNSKVSASQSQQAAKFQPPTAQDVQSQAAPEMSAGAELLESSRPGFLRQLVAPVTDPIDTFATAAGVAIRRAVPTIIGGIEGTMGRLGEAIIEFEVAKNPVQGAIIRAQNVLDGRDPDDVMGGLSRHLALTSLGAQREGDETTAFLADMMNVGLHTARANIDAGSRKMDSFIAWNFTEDRWGTMSSEQYEREILKDPLGVDPGKQAGMFIGNALTSAVQMAIALVQPQLAPAVLGSFFTQGFAGAAQGYEDVKKSRGEIPSATNAFLHGVGGGTVELAFESFQLGTVKKTIKATRQSLNARLGRAIAEEAAGSPGAIRRAVDSVAAVTPDFAKAIGKTTATNALQETATQVSNNLREMLTYDPANPGDGYFGKVTRLLRGVPEAALGGAIGGAPFGAGAGLGAMSASENRVQAREAAARLRKSVPDAPVDLAPEATTATERAPEPSARPGGLSAPKGSERLAEAFKRGNEEGAKQRRSGAIGEARATGEAPIRSELASGREDFLSEGYADELVASHPEFALQILESAKGAKGAISRIFAPYVYRGKERLSEADRRTFVDNVRKAVKLSKGGRGIKRRPEAEIRNEIKAIGKKVKDGTATEQDRKSLAKLEAELVRRKNEAAKTAKADADVIAVEEEVADEVGPEPVIDDRVPEAEEAAPKAEPKAKPEPKPEPKAEPKPEAGTDPVAAALEEGKEFTISDADFDKVEEINAEYERNQEELDSLTSDDPASAERMEELAERQAELDKEELEIFRKYEDQIENAVEEVPVPEDPAPVPEPVEVEQSTSDTKLATTIRGLEANVKSLEEQIDNVTTKTGRAKKGKAKERDALVERLNEANDALAERRAAAASRKTEREAKARNKERTEALLEKPLPGRKGKLATIIGKMGFLGQNASGKSLSDLTDQQLHRIAKRELNIRAGYAKSFGREALIEEILSARLLSTGVGSRIFFQDDSLNEVQQERRAAIVKILFAPRQKGEGGKSISDVIAGRMEILRLNQQERTELSDGLEDVTPKRPKAKKIVGREARPLKATSDLTVEQANAIVAARYKAAQDRREAADKAVPGTLGVLSPLSDLPTRPAPETREETQSRLRREARDRTRQDDDKKPTNKMTKAEGWAEIIDEGKKIARYEGKTDAEIKRQITREFAAKGVKFEGKGGKAAVIGVVNDIRAGETPLVEGRAAPVQKATKMSPEQKAEKEKQRMALLSELRAASVRKAKAAQKRREARQKELEEKKESKGVQPGREENNDRVMRSMKAIRFRVNLALGRFAEMVESFEAGDVRGRDNVKRGRKVTKSGKARYWGSGTTIDLASEFPRLWSIITENMDPRRAGAYLGDTVRSMTPKEFAQRFGAESLFEGRDLEGAEALAILEDVADMLDQSVIIGDEKLIADQAKLLAAEGIVEIRLSPTEDGSLLPESVTVEAASGETVAEASTSQDLLDILDKQQASQRAEDQAAADQMREELDEDFDDDALNFSTGEVGEVIRIKSDEGGAELIEGATVWLQIQSLKARILGKVGKSRLSQWLRTEIATIDKAVTGQQVELAEAQKEIDRVVNSKKSKALGLKKGDLEAVPDSAANPVEMAVVRKMRKRGRTVVLYRANTAAGTVANGFVSADNNTMYIRVGSLGADVFSKIRDPRARRMIEREYERIVMQVVRHENAHLVERDPDAEGFRALTDVALNIATGRPFAGEFRSQEEAIEYAVDVLGMSESDAKKLASTKAGRDTIVSELRAEAASQIDSFRASGAESLYTDRNIIERTMDRIRRILTKAGFRGEMARRVLEIAEVELKLNLVEASKRVPESKKKRNKSPLFSADLEMYDEPMFIASGEDILFSAERFSRREGFVRQRERWQDRNIRLRNATRDITEAYGELPDDINPLQLVDIAPGLVARKSRSFMEDEFTPLAEEMVKAGITTQEMGEYLHAKHAKEANEYLGQKTGDKRDSGMTDEQADEVIAQVEGRSDARQFMAFADRYQKIGRDNLDLMREAGLITEEDYNKLKDTYEFYVPLADPTHDAKYDKDDQEPVLFGGQAQIGRAMLYRKGREVEVDNVQSLASDQRQAFHEGIVLHLAMQRNRIVRRAIRNQINNRILDLSLSLAGTDAKDEFVIEAGPRDKQGRLRIQKLREESGNTKLVVRLNRSRVLLGKAYEKGEQIVIKTKDPKMARILNTTGKTLDDVAGGKLKFLGAFTRMKRALATRYNIEFTLVNPVRDLQEASASLKVEGFGRVRRRLAAKALSSFATVLAHQFSGKTSSKAYQEYLDSGAPQDVYGMQTSKDIQRAMKYAMKKATRGERGIPVKIFFGAEKILGGLFGSLSKLTNAFDDGVRFAAWQMAKEEGFTTEKATALSRDVTVDFSRRGDDMGSYANSIYAFSNVGTQGIEKLVRKFGSLRVMKTAFGYGFVNSLLCSLAFDDEEWESIPDYIKQTNFIIPCPWKDAEGRTAFIKIPMPYGIGSVCNGGRVLGEAMFRGGDYADPVGAVGDVAASFWSLNPLGGTNIVAEETTPTDDRFFGLRTSGVANLILPDILDPAVGLTTDYDWTGRRIFPRSYSDSQVRADSGFDSTNAMWKGIAKGINEGTGGRPEVRSGGIDMSPEFYRFMAHETLFGPAKLLDRIIGLFDVDGIPTTASQRPILRRFYGEASERVRQNNSRDFYEFKHYYEEARRFKNRFEESDMTLREYVEENEYTRADLVMYRGLLRMGEDDMVKAALNFGRKFNDLKSQANADNDEETLNRIFQAKSKLQAHAAKLYREMSK